MNPKQMEKIWTDVLVIGGGGAGARAAIEASDQGAAVRLILKGRLGSSGATAYPAAEYAGFQAADGCDPGDSPEDHLRDILEAAQGMCNPRLARIIAEEAPEALKTLERFGVPFLKDNGGKHVTGKACFSTRFRSHRILGHGEPIIRALAGQIKRRPIHIDEDTMAASLLVQDKQCTGALTVDPAGRRIAYLAKATVLASGGAGQLFKANLNPVELTGDGYAMAYNAGADLVNMEFMQAGFAISSPLTLLGAWTWAYNPILTNGDGEEFLPRYLPEGVTPSEVFAAKAGHYPFSSRDLSKYLEISALHEIRNGKKIFFDLRDSQRLHEFKERPLYTWLVQRGLDLSREPAPIAVYAHAINGGVLIDEKASSTIPGLFAAGEVAGGPHGADRLGGNMLATCQVFGARAGRFAALYAGEIDRPAWRPETLEQSERSLLIAHPRSWNQAALETKKEIQDLMFETLIIERREVQLRKALARLNILEQDPMNPEAGESSGMRSALETRNLLKVARIMISASMMREESRGSHYRADFPATDNRKWNRSIVSKLESGRLKQYTVSLEKENLP